MTDTYNEDVIQSDEIRNQTNAMVAAGQYVKAFELYQTDPLAVDGVTFEQFVKGTLDSMRRAFENFQAIESHGKAMSAAG